MKLVIRWVRDLTVTFVVVFILFEVTLRLFPSLIPPTILIYFNDSLRASIAHRLELPIEDDFQELVRSDDGPRLQIYKPNTTIKNQFTDAGSKDVTVDEKGFCNGSNTYSQNDIFDYVVIGDSFAFCTNVDTKESWASKMGVDLGKRVYNLGSPHKGLYEYLQILERYGLSKNPKTVIMAVYEGNDLRDAIKYFEYKEKQGRGSKEGVEDCGTSKMCRAYINLMDTRIGRSSYAYNLSLVSVRMLRGKTVDSISGVDHVTDFSYKIEGPEGAVVLNPDNTDEDEAINAKRLQEGEITLDVFDEALVKFKELSISSNFKPIIVYIPSAYTAYDKEVSFSDSELYPIMKAYSEKQRDYFAVEADRLEITFFDTTSALQNVASDYKTDDKLLYFPHNVHLTPYGHLVVSDFLVAKLLLMI